VHSRDLVVPLSSVGKGRLMMRKMGNQSRVRDFRQRVILLFFTHFFSIVCRSKMVFDPPFRNAFHRHIRSRLSWQLNLQSFVVFVFFVSS